MWNAASSCFYRKAKDRMKKISILIPCYNEVENVDAISAAIEKTLKEDLILYFLYL